MWEYSASENRFGTPEALMLLPYWTNGCIDSMEGLLFESSTTTPYHFLNQAELSAGPSEPEVGLPYGALDVTLGVQHLQLLGVKYFMAETPAGRAGGGGRPDLATGRQDRPVDLQLRRRRHPHHVGHLPGEGLSARHSSGQRPGCPLGRQAGAIELARQRHPRGPALSWYADPSKWDVELAQSGPPDWPRTPVSDIQPDRQARRVHQGDRRVSRPTPPSASTSPGWGRRSWSRSPTSPTGMPAAPTVRGESRPISWSSCPRATT